MIGFLVLLRHLIPIATPTSTGADKDTHREIRLNPRGGGTLHQGEGANASLHLSRIVTIHTYNLFKLVYGKRLTNKKGPSRV